MKITKRQLKRIIKEEAAKLVAEAWDDGMAPDPDYEKDQLTKKALSDLDKIILFVMEESDMLGDPRARSTIFKKMAEKLHTMR